MSSHRVEVTEVLCDSLNCGHDEPLRWVPHPPEPWWVRAWGWVYWKVPFPVRRRLPSIRARWRVVYTRLNGSTSHGFYRERDARMFAAGRGVPDDGDIWLERWA